MALTNEQVLEKLKSKFADDILSAEEQYGTMSVFATPDSNIEILKYIFNEPELQIQFMTDLTAVHYPDQDQDFAVVYHMHSLIHNFRFRLKFLLSKENLNIRSATPVYAAANWMERETFDFFGINFVGHPNLKRILNVDDMEVFPMRKEYPLEDPNRVDKKDYFFGR